MVYGFQVAFDCADPARVGRFWVKALGYVVPDPPAGYATWEEQFRAWGLPESEWGSVFVAQDPEGVRPRLFFHRVPEARTVKNRLHLDINVSPGHKAPLEQRREIVDREVRRLEGEGATRLRAENEPQYDEYFVVVEDVEGNVFCVQ